MQVLKPYLDAFWDERHWFPPGVNWSMLQSTEFEKYPDFCDLWYPLYFALIIIVIRFIFEWSIARPLGRCFGIKDTYSELPVWISKVSYYLFGKQFQVKSCSKNFSSSEHLSSSNLVANGDFDCSHDYNCSDNSYANNKKLASNNCDSVRLRLLAGGDNTAINGASIAHQSELQNATVEGDVGRRSADRQLKTRIKQSHTIVRLVAVKSTLDKFAESCWRGVYYFGIFIYGIVVLWDKPWFRDTAFCWHGYPFQPIDNECWWYYMVEAGFYWSLTISQFVDVQRKDFWVNFVHHLATLLLIYFSWADNFIRLGTLVLICHDTVDFWMEAAKMARYCRCDSLCNVFFVIFALLWFITRLGLFPFSILYSTLIEAPALVSFNSAYYTFNFLLLILLILHIFWSIMIMRIIINTFRSGQANDVRSDDEGSDDDLSVNEQ